MGDRTGIEWTEATWNPVTGCTKVSPGCDHCYAESIAHRFAGTAAYPQGFAPTLRPDRLAQPARWTRPRRIFVCSMADLFHDEVPDEYIATVFAVMAAAPQHTFQVLTKRHGRLRSLLSSSWFRHMVGLAYLGDDVIPANAPATIIWPLPNVWIGVSAEDQKRADLRIPALLETPAAVRWVSAEPLLGAIDLHPYWTNGRPTWGSESKDPTGNGVAVQDLIVGPRLDWVVAGGESGRFARPMHPEWARQLRDQCTAGGVAFLFKQWGNWAPTEGRDGMKRGDMCLSEDGERDVVGPDYVCVSNESDGTWLRKVGKKAAGRELDGALHDGYPASDEAVEVRR